ncbi:NAD-dependent epimerase/dehydratase family protein [Paenibacillus hubeiensis]|uniref:NAD-dependent epimerase/dehydratase family protein n=1 Tax=Paenibacillus hubeiensis TaxID=3077330 RepID=UPI0031BADC54
MMKMVITGPTGAIGMALIQLCIDKQIEVLAICRKSSPGLAYMPQDPLLHIIEADLDEYATLELPGQYDVFYHFAWASTIGESRNDVYTQNQNVTYTLDAVRLAKRLGCHTFIGAGSQAEYGRSGMPLTPLTPVFPETGYGVAKLCAGQLSRILCEQLQIKHIWTRILSVYGPYDDERTMVISTIKKMLSQEVLLFTQGEQMWDFLYSVDAANILYQLSINGKNLKTYCVGSGECRKLKTFIEEMHEVIAPEQKPVFGAIPYGKNQVMHLVADLVELEQDIGQITFTPFALGIRETMEDVIRRFDTIEKGV